MFLKFLTIIALTASLLLLFTEVSTGLEETTEESNSVRSDIQLADCSCSNGKCQKNEKGKMVCMCNKGYGPVESSGSDVTKCKKCDCAAGFICRYEWKWIKDKQICFCPEGFKENGGKCTGLCDSNPCRNGGKCSIVGGKVNCSCIAPYTGDSCQKSPCDSNPCRNEGKCSILKGQLHCSCIAPYTGDKCEKITCTKNEDCSSLPNMVCSIAEKICKCKVGFEGDDCKIVTGCKTLAIDCARVDADCIFSENDEGKATCKCRMKRFVYREKGCFALCAHDSDCAIEPIKKCTQNVCKCKEGYEGTNCGTITGCYTLNPDCENADADCVFDAHADLKAKCQCRKDKFVYKDKKCVAWCAHDSDCEDQPIKKCTQNICKCTEGYEGTNCETVSGCYTLNPDCENADADCVFDANADLKAKCQCRKKNFFYKDKKCIVPCDDTSDYSCKNQGTCEGEADGLKFCKCKDGTSGDDCAVVDKCVIEPEYCGVGNDVICVFDEVSPSLARCECRDIKKLFDTRLKICRTPCDGTSEFCKNGAKCKGGEKAIFCTCKKGTSGDDCGVIDKCSNDPQFCGEYDDATCFYHEKLEDAKCRCKVKRKIYDSDDKICREVCGDDSSEVCEKGKECWKVLEGKITCACKQGYGGNLCKNQIGCRTEAIEKCKKANAYCKFTAQEGETCECKKKDEKYDKISNMCRTSCAQDEDCRNQPVKKCHARQRLCMCREGYEGSYCERITGCKHLEQDCKNAGANCIFDDNVDGKAICQCRNEKLVYKNKQCLSSSCTKDEDCKDAIIKKCHPTEKVCKCIDGYEGSECNVITGCKILGKDCDDAGAYCTFDATSNHKATCRCKIKNYLYENKYCKDVCNPNPCNNRGMCLVEGNVVKCTCSIPYTGDKCEKSPCDSNPCKNNGMCSVEGPNVNCTCKVPYFGDSCQKSPCDLDPCKNGGKCSIYEGKVACDCIRPFTGDKCEKSPCDLKPCKNGGKCSVIEEKVACACISPFTGDRCEKSSCDSNPCKNGGKCSIYEGKVVCDCIRPFTGDKCEKTSCIDASDCGKRETCNHSLGFCECKPGYEGDWCYIVSGCLKLEKNCTRAGAECVYDETSVNKASCKCIAERHVYDPVFKQCKDLCEPNPCKNGGSCVTVDRDSRCFCQLPFYGTTCQLGNPCQDNPCKNGGSCVVDGINSKCICKEYFSGSLCETDVKYKSLIRTNIVIIVLQLMLFMLIACYMIRRKTIKGSVPSV